MACQHKLIINYNRFNLRIILINVSEIYMFCVNVCVKEKETMAVEDKVVEELLL